MKYLSVKINLIGKLALLQPVSGPQQHIKALYLHQSSYPWVYCIRTWVGIGAILLSSLGGTLLFLVHLSIHSLPSTICSLFIARYFIVSNNQVIVGSRFSHIQWSRRGLRLFCMETRQGLFAYLQHLGVVHFSRMIYSKPFSTGPMSWVH